MKRGNDMFEKFINRIIELSRPEIVEVKNQSFSTSELHLIPESPRVGSMDVRSLVGVVDYIKSNFDGERKLLIHIESQTKIALIDQLDHTNDRRTYIRSSALLPDITFGRFMDREQFQIMMQSTFVPNTDRAAVLAIISNIVVKDGVVEMKDNGLTQEVAIQVGAATRDNIEVPERVALKPFRTFTEVEQPESEFILRLNKDGNVGLFEADGGVWKHHAINSIAEYFKEQLKDEIEAGNIHILR